MKEHTEIWIDSGAVRLHAVTAGSGPAVVLLHGFPEFWWTWRHQIDALSQSGYQVIAPDLRGYNLSDKPVGVANYHMRKLIDDVAAVVKSSGQSKAHIVGHDWGGLIAWAFAAAYPELVDKLVILNSPHIKIYLDKVFKPPQVFRSWYVLFFQLPFLPELALSANNFKEVRRMFTDMPYNKGEFTRDVVDRYIEALARPQALTSALNYYRCNFRHRGGLLMAAKPVHADTLVIWGEHDPALDLCLLDGLETVVPNAQIQRIPDASHWIQNESPDKVNSLLLDFFKQH